MYMYGWMGGWVGGWMDGWMGGWMVNYCLCVYVKHILLKYPAGR